MIQINLLAKQKRLIDLENELMVPRGEKMGRRDSYGVWDEHVRIAVFKMGNQQGPTL